MESTTNSDGQTPGAQGENLVAGNKRAAWHRWVPVCVFCLALLVRLAYLAEDSGSPFFEYRGVDAGVYYQMALGFAQGTWPDQQPFPWPPLYPMFLGLLCKFLGSGIGMLKVVQAIIGSMSCVLVYFIARQAFEERLVATVASVACCLCGTMIFLDGQLLSSNLDVFLQLLAVWALLSAAQQGRMGRWWFAGMCLGLCAINRGGILLFVPLAVVWAYAHARWWPVPSPADGAPVLRFPFWRKAVALVVPVAVLVFPVSWHNATYDPIGPGNLPPLPRVVIDGPSPASVTLSRMASGEFTSLATYVGVNFYLGNHWADRHLNDPNHPECFSHYGEVLRQPAEEGVTSASGQSRYLIRKTLDDIRDEPGDFLKLAWLKLSQLVNGNERPRNSNIYAFRQHSALLSVLLWKKVVAFPSGLIIPLGLLGIVVGCRDWRRRFPLLALLAAQAVFILCFFVTARYRLPCLPFLAMFAAFGAVAVVRFVQHGTGAKTVASALLLAGLLVVSNAQIGKMETSHGAWEHRNLGLDLFRGGRIHAATRQFEDAIRMSPRYAKAHLNLANVLALQDKIEEAEAHYDEAVRLDPSTADPMALHGLALELARRGDLEKSEARFEAALRLRPDYAEAHIDFGRALLRQGRLDEAAAHFTEGLRLKPALPNARCDFGSLLALQGRLDEAIMEFREVLKLDPGHALARKNLDEALGSRRPPEQP